MTERTLDLRVRAQLQGTKDLAEVAKSISKIGTAIDSQTEAAKRGENRIDELKGSLEALALIQKELQGQSSAIKYFQDLSNGLASTEAKLAAATKRYDDYNKKLEEAGKRTDAQQERLIKYGVAVEKSNKALQAQRDRLAAMEKEFSDAGLAVDKLGDVLARNKLLQEQQALTLVRAKDAMKGYATEVRNARDAQAESARQAAEAVKVEKQRLAILEQQRAQAAAEAAGIELDYRRMTEADKRRTTEAEKNAQARANAIRAEQQAQARAEAAGILRDADASKRKSLVDDAERQARAFTTLARAATDLNPKMSSFRDVVKEILDPSRAATSTLSEMEKQVAALAAGVVKINGPIKGYREQADALANAQRNIQAQAGLIDNFNKQAVALRAARAEFVSSRAEVAKYASLVAMGGAQTDQFAAKLAQAQAQLRGSAQALAQQVVATRESRDVLRAAGVATNDLAGSQSRLNAAATSTVNTLNRLQAGYRQYGAAVDKANRSQGLFASDGRTTLSYVQRLRGEILSLVSAYGGLYTVINTAQGALEASRNRESAKTVIGVGLGTTDRKAIDAEYEYVRGQADRIGLVFDETVKEYGKFATAAAKSGRTRDEIRSVFEAFAEGGAVLKLTTADMNGVFTALTQVFSKGKLGAEELRQQLGERLPGIFEVAQQALKSQFPDLNKAMEQGKVGAEQLVLVAEAYRKMVADQLPAAQKSLVAQQNRLTNEVNNFKLAVADSGFLDSYTEAIATLTEFLRSDDGKNFATNVGLAFKAMAEVFVFLLKNIDDVILAVQILLGVFAVGRFVAAGKAVYTMGKDFIALKDAITPALNAVDTFLARFGTFGEIFKRALGAASAYLIGWQIGTYLREKFQIVRDAGIYLVTAIATTIAVIKASYEAAFAAVPEYAARAFNKVLKTIADAARSITRIFAKLAGAAGFDELAGQLDRAANSMEVSTRKEIDVLGNYRASLAKEMANIKSIRDDMLAEPMGGASGKTATARTVASPTKSPGGTVGKGKPGPSEAEIRKRENEIEAITRALESLDAKIDRSQTETLSKQLEAIDSQYAALARRIEKLGGETGKAFMSRLTATIVELKDITIKKFNDDLMKEQNAFLKKTGDAEEQAGKRERQSLSYRLGAIVGDYDQLYKELADLRTKFEANNRDTAPLDQAKRRLDIAKNMRLEQETTKYNTEQLDQKEKLLNDTLAARDKIIAAINQRREVGQIDDVQAAKELNDVQAQYLPKINEAAEATRKWAMENAKIFDSPESQQAFLATLDAIQAKANGVQVQFSLLGQTVVNSLVNAVNNGLNLMADGLQGIASGTMTVREGFLSMLTGFAQFAAQFLRDIAIMIIKMQIFKAMQSSGNIYVQAAGTAGLNSMGVRHSGGIIGSIPNRKREVPWFGVAPRYHSGGLMGVGRNEYQTILEKGEEVLAKDSPRNILNGGAGIGGAVGGGAVGSIQATIVDDRSSVPAAMATPGGTSVVLEILRSNVSTVKQMLGG